MDTSGKASITPRAAGPVTVVDIEGDFSVTTCPVPTLHDLVKGEVARGARQVLFHFGKAGFVDSFGIGQIIASYKSLHDLGGALKLCVVPSKLLSVLIIVGIVPRILKAYPTEEAALASFVEQPGTGD